MFISSVTHKKPNVAQNQCHINAEIKLQILSQRHVSSEFAGSRSDSTQIHVMVYFSIAWFHLDWKDICICCLWFARRGAWPHCNCFNNNFEALESINTFQGKFWSLIQEVKVTVLSGPISWIYFVFIYMGFHRRGLFRITLL
jgi:hypothetical protein